MLLILLASGAASAASFNERLSEANSLLSSGRYDEAVAMLDELKVDYPERPAIDYALGVAQYQRAEGLNAAGKPGEALAAYQDAENRFAGISAHADEEVAVAAAFARANAMAQQAKMTAASPDKFKEGVAALRKAEQAYVELIKRAPGLVAAQRNLDHVRLTLKRMLQNPPQNPEQPEQEEQEQQQPPQPQPRVFSVFRGATTELPNATATFDGNTAILQPGGVQP
ncbi:MAG: hypothetical protein RLZZ303_1369 [Candidatus Hydrogenedentota bacterium]|jgi:tetratricopeptide (TPR) repeat protein